jgi:hypothetical protein
MIAYSGKIWHLPAGKQVIMLLSFMVAVIVMASLDGSAAGWLNASDALVAVGLGTAMFVMLVKCRLDINLALYLLLMYLIGYCFFRNWIFAAHLSVISQQTAPLYESYMNRIPNLKLTPDIIASVQNIILTYQTAIWGSMHIAAAFFGFLLFNRTSTLKYPVRFIRLPYPLVYGMILAIGMFLYPATRVIGTNLLICMSMLYLIQGTAVLSFVWGGFFAKARLLRTMLIMAIILNYPVMILIALIGVLDVWFNFRKLTFKEEIHESHIN